MFKEGRVALVTGAAGGIGREIVKQLALQGVRIAAVDVKQEYLESVVDMVEEIGVEILSLPVDITSEEQCADAVEKIMDRWNRVDILVNCAGILLDKTIKNLTLEDWDKVQNVNVKGPLFFTKHLYQIMKEQKYGRIINISSPAWKGNFGQAAYGASKAALISLTKTTSLELVKYGVTANVVFPGLVKTAILSSLPEEMFEKFKKQMPTGRLCEPYDVARAVTFFADDDASYISGQLLYIEGGASTDLV